MTSVRQTTEGVTRTFLGSALQRHVSKKETPLPKHNGERQKPGRWHAPQDSDSSTASVAKDLALALTESRGAILANVFGRQFTTLNTPNTMQPTTTTTEPIPKSTPLTTNGTMVPKWYLGTNYCKGGVLA